MDPVTLALAKSWAEGEFGDLRQLQQHIAALQTVSGLAPVANELQAVSELAPYVQALLSSRIVEMGENANGRYIRWENGVQVCLVEVPATKDIDIAWGALYYATVGPQPYPAAFISRPYVGMANQGFNSVIFGTRSGSAFSTPFAEVYRAVALSNASFSVTYVAIGFWK